MSKKTITAADRRKAAKMARDYRAAQHISQYELADHVGTHQTIISQAERAFSGVPPRVVRALLQLAA